MQNISKHSAAADEDKDIAVADIGSHLLLDNSYQGIYSLAHIRPTRTQMVAHGIVKTEHGLHHALQQHFHEHRLTASAEMGPYAVGESQRHSRQFRTGHGLRFRYGTEGLADADGRNRHGIGFRLELFAPVIVSGIGHSFAAKKLLEGCAA